MVGFFYLKRGLREEFTKAVWMSAYSTVVSSRDCLSVSMRRLNWVSISASMDSGKVASSKVRP